MLLDELNTRGWAVVSGVTCSEDLLMLGRSLGQPMPSPNNEMVKEIRITDAAAAAPGSQSALYGTGPFPLHTDTVFWPTPARYVILRGYGDTRRPTTVMSFSHLLQKGGAAFRSLLEQSVWTVGTESKRFYCSLRFRCGDSIGWRYDSDGMSPANSAAIEVNATLKPLVTGAPTACIDWSGDTAVVLSNWNALHGRGPRPPDEGERVIERVYVR